MVLFLRAVEHTLLIIGLVAIGIGIASTCGWLIGLGVFWLLCVPLFNRWAIFFSNGDKT
jgi:hypothetical protein